MKKRIIETKNLICDQEVVDDKICHLTFEGDLDEDFLFADLLEGKFTEYVINMGAVGLINSCGTREWIQFIDNLPKNTKVTYVRCPQVVIKQMNLVDGFLPKNSTVESFYAPYYSEKKDVVCDVLLHVAEIEDMKAPRLRDDDGNEMEFDAHERQYFTFITKIS